MPNTFIPIAEFKKNNNSPYHYHLNHLYKPEMTTDDLAEIIWREDSTDAYNLDNNQKEKKEFVHLAFQDNIMMKRQAYIITGIGTLIQV